MRRWSTGPGDRHAPPPDCQRQCATTIYGHTLASELLSAGLSPIAVAAVLGDEPGTVLDTYGHVVASDHDRVRSVVRRCVLRLPRTQ